jgi:hypothetical protein
MVSAHFPLGMSRELDFGTVLGGVGLGTRVDIAVLIRRMLVAITRIHFR